MTAHEALYTVCIDSMQWLEPEHDLPAHVRGAFEEWRRGLLDDGDCLNAGGRLIERLRHLDLDQAKRKLDDLLHIALVIQE